MTQPTAYHKWLMKVSEGDIDHIVKMIEYDVMIHHNPQAFDLLEQTGDKTYTDETFLKAAKMVVEMCETKK